MNVYKKTKYPILVLLLFGILFSIYNYINKEEYIYYVEYEFLLILISTLIVFFFLPRKLKLDFKILAISACIIALFIIFINLNLANNSYQINRQNKILNDYATKDCDLARKQFKKDLKNKELKYFSFGMFYPSNLSRNLKKYNVKNFHVGCVISGEYNCYNKLVEEFLLTKFKIKPNSYYLKNL